MSAFLEVSGLTKVYRGGWGLHDVSLTLPVGVIAALGGPNGSGKSTLLRCLAGLSRHTGRSTLEGEPLGDDPRTRRRVGFLPQTLVFALGECAGLGDDWPARAREAAAPGVFLTPVPECYAAGARRVMELFQHYLFGEGRWEDLPPGGIGRG